MTFDMQFEEWWHKNDYDLHYGKNIKKITQSAWNAATAAERQRCREIIDEFGRYADIVEMLEQIGE